MHSRSRTRLTIKSITISYLFFLFLLRFSIYHPVLSRLSLPSLFFPPPPTSYLPYNTNFSLQLFIYFIHSFACLICDIYFFVFNRPYRPQASFQQIDHRSWDTKTPALDQALESAPSSTPPVVAAAAAAAASSPYEFSFITDVNHPREEYRPNRGRSQSRAPSRGYIRSRTRSPDHRNYFQRSKSAHPSRR